MAAEHRREGNDDGPEERGQPAGSIMELDPRTRNGKVQIMASQDVATPWPMAQPTSQPVLMRPETVGVSAVLVDATLRRRDRIMSSASDSVMLVAEGSQPDYWTQSGNGLPRRMEG